jgi:hypothetical protein
LPHGIKPPPGDAQLPGPELNLGTAGDPAV